MPWNQPGSGGDKDPWGKKNNQQQGPPDLDELFRDLKARFGKGLGGGDSGEGKSFSPSGPGKGLSLLLVLVALGFWLATGFYKVNQGEEGIELLLGKYSKTTEAGLHWRLPAPITTVEVVNVSHVNTVEVGYRSRGRASTTVPQEALMLTQDENIIDIQFAVQYDIKSATDLLFNVGDPIESVVRQATESAVRETVGHNGMDFAITDGRAQIATGTQTLVQQILDRYQTGINIRSVEMQNAQPPEQVKDAFDDAVRAREDEERLKNLAEAYAADVIPKARGNSARIMQEAEGYKAATIALAEGEASRFDQVRIEYQKAPEVTRDRLYIETMESVLGNSTKMIIDQQKGGNSVMYLPLDKMMQQGNQAARQPSAGAIGSTSSVAPNLNNSTTNSTRSGRGGSRSVGR